MTANLIHRVADIDVVSEAVAMAEAHLNDAGLPGYNRAILALESIIECTNNESNIPADRLLALIRNAARGGLGQ